MNGLGLQSRSVDDLGPLSHSLANDLQLMPNSLIKVSVGRFPLFELPLGPFYLFGMVQSSGLVEQMVDLSFG